MGAGMASPSEAESSGEIRPAQAVPTSHPPPAAAAAAASSTSPAAQSFDWYADPLLYDIIFEDDTPVETRMLRHIAKHFAHAGSPLARIQLEGDGDAAEEKTPECSTLSVIRVLEPACGSARLMLSLLEAGQRDRGLQWSVVGFDCSVGAVEFAQRRWEELQRKLKPADDEATAAAAALPAPAASFADASVPPFSAFVADLSDFTSALPPAPCPRRFDLAHCLVSSLKHLLTPESVLRHFAQVHSTLEDQALYIVAMHIHTLSGKSHFDRDLLYTAAAIGSSPAAVKADASVTPATSAAAISDEAKQPVDDAFEADFARGDTRFRAELVTYAPDESTMLEKMIARVQLTDAQADASPAAATVPRVLASGAPATARAAAAASAASASAASGGVFSPPAGASSPPLQSDMTLRVYTLSSLHTLLCAVAPWFSLECTYGYADIYSDEWEAAAPEWKLTYPYPRPAWSQVRPKDATNPQSSNDATGSDAPSLAASVAALSRPQRNWNRVFPVSRSVREEWEGVDAVVLVLRKRDFAASPNV